MPPHASLPPLLWQSYPPLHPYKLFSLLAPLALLHHQVNLKVLVWDGSFGADVKELRMPLPELYPSSTTPYDQNEDVEARTLAEAIVSFFMCGGGP